MIALNANPFLPGFDALMKPFSLFINEGNHRITAALEIYNKNGDPSPLMKLLNEGNWTAHTTVTAARVL